MHFKSRDHYITAANPDDSGQTDYRKWLPSATLSWQATERLLGYTSYARGFETPTMNELSYRDNGSGLNFGLQPASNQTYEIGAKYSGWLGGLASVAAFRINTDNEIVVKSSSNGRTVYQNAGKTRRHGIELAWSGEIAPISMPRWPTPGSMPAINLTAPTWQTTTHSRHCRTCRLFGRRLRTRARLAGRRRRARALQSVC